MCNRMYHSIQYRWIMDHIVHTKDTRFVGLDVDWRLARAVNSTLRVREFRVRTEC